MTASNAAKGKRASPRNRSTQAQSTQSYLGPPPPELTGQNGHSDGEVPRVVRLTTAAPETETERIPLFYIDDTMFSMPARPPASMALKYLRIARTQGAEPAASYMLEAMLGEDAYTALMDHEQLTMEQLKAVIDIAAGHLMGSIEVPKEQ